MIDLSKWSANLAYAVGLIATDGNLSGDGRHIDLTSKDIDQLKNFDKCLGLETTITYKTSGFSEKLYSRIQFSNVKLYRWLQSIGLTPKKSKTIGSINVPNRYFFDFLRGHFDGDGCIYSYWDKRWKSSFMFYVEFISASRLHLEWIRDSITELLGFEGKIGLQTRAYKLVYAKKNSREIIREMYKKKCICLKRKKDKVDKILKIEPGW